MAGIRVRVCGTKSRKKVAGKVRPRGAQGSIELNINSSLCFGKNSHLNLIIKQTIFLVMRANTSRKQHSSWENHLELAVMIFFQRQVGGGSIRQSKGLSLQFSPSPTLWPDTQIINRSILLLSPLIYKHDKCILETSCLICPQQKCCKTLAFTFGFMPSHPALTWALCHVRLLDTNERPEWTTCQRQSWQSEVF